MKRKDHRQGYLINRPFQLKLILGANILAVSLSAGLFGLMRFFADKVLLRAGSLQLPPNHPFLRYLHHSDGSLLMLCLVAGLFIVTALNVLGLVISHRIAGPLHRLRRHLEDAAEGKTTADVRFRDDDYFPELANACNRLMARIRASGGTPRSGDEGLRSVPDSRSAR